MTDKLTKAKQYLTPGACVPIDMETTTLLVDALRQALAEPPRKPWVSLTDDEKWAIFTSKDWTGRPLSLIDAVLTAYEEKNRE